MCSRRSMLRRGGDPAEHKARTIIDELRAARTNTAAELVERCVDETLTYYAFQIHN